MQRARRGLQRLVIADIHHALTPSLFLPWLIAIYAALAAIFIRGLAHRRCRADILPALAFLTGLAGLYLFTQTRLDHYGRCLFLAHRIQHLVLHHLAPFLIAWAAPSVILAAGAPQPLAQLARRAVSAGPVRRLYQTIQQPLVGGALYVGLILFWLYPPIHGRAMHSAFGYWLMNLGMVVDGLLFWWFMLDRRPPGSSPTTHSAGLRIVVLWLIMPAQIAVGAYITLTRHLLYHGHALCERALGISAMTDQQIGGLLTWIPPAMMSLIGTLVLLSFGFQHAKGKPGSDR